ncbi:MAG: hypothetical protein RI922_2541 [Bacteroidota bacterium]|jgi:uncharacterized membrane protein YgdD (TMEM256/DUF423 family)
MNKRIVLTAAVLLMLAIILGAFGAHGLKDKVSPERIATFEVGVRYQFYIGLAMLILGFNEEKLGFSLKPTFLLLLIGVLFFSVSIYFLAIQEILGASLKFLGPITPLGGLLMIIGFLIFLVKLMRK